MRILWLSDSPTTPTGLGNTTRSLCHRLARLGHESSVVGWQHSGGPTRRRDYTLYPVGDLASEAALLLEYLRQLRPDVLITVADVWRVAHVAHPAITRFRRAANIPWALYYPIDSDRSDRRLPARLVRTLRAADLPIVMSRHGWRVTRSTGVRADYIPVGVDTKMFRPARDRRSAKRALGYGDYFVVLSDARNQVRKLWPRVLEIFRRFAADKDDVVLHLHCDPYDPAAISEEYHYDLISDIRCLRLSDKVRLTRDMSIMRGISLPRLAALYRAADVHLLSSFAEGFGLPTLQAAASGVVPMAPAYAANAELVRGHGEAIRVRSYVRRESGLRCAFVDIDDAVRRLERLYRNRRLRDAKSRTARRFALTYDWDRIAVQWHDVLRRLVRRSQPSARTVSHQTSTVEPLARYQVTPPRCTVTIPVTLPTRLRGGEARVTGRIYLASEADLPVFARLRRIFPGLSAWSTNAAFAGRLHRPPVELVNNALGGAPYRRRVATSTLALDVAGRCR